MADCNENICIIIITIMQICHGVDCMLNHSQLFVRSHMLYRHRILIMHCLWMNTYMMKYFSMLIKHGFLVVSFSILDSPVQLLPKSHLLKSKVIVSIYFKT